MFKKENRPYTFIILAFIVGFIAIIYFGTAPKYNPYKMKIKYSKKANACYKMKHHFSYNSTEYKYYDSLYKKYSYLSDSCNLKLNQIK